MISALQLERLEEEQQVVAQYTDPNKPFDKDEAQALMDSISKNKDQG